MSSSGAAGRRRKLAAEEQAAVDAQTERQRKKHQRLEAEERKSYRKYGPPPADSVQRLAWANGFGALVGYWAGVWEGTPGMKASRRTILETVRTVGMTTPKALYEERLKKLEAHVYGKRRIEQGGDEKASDDGLTPYPGKGKPPA